MVLYNGHQQSSAMSEMGQQEIAFNTKESQCDGHLGKYEVGKDKKSCPKTLCCDYKSVSQVGQHFWNYFIGILLLLSCFSRV